jgi:hypothetical protein
MISASIYRDTEIAALQAIAKLCEEYNMAIEWRDERGELHAKCSDRRIHVWASIRPSRECDGICLSVRSPVGRRILDGQDYEFLHSSCRGHTQLDVYLTALLGELS